MNAPLLLKSTHPILSLRGSWSVTANDFKKGRLGSARILGLCVSKLFRIFQSVHKYRKVSDAWLFYIVKGVAMLPFSFMIRLNKNGECRYLRKGSLELLIRRSQVRLGQGVVSLSKRLHPSCITD